MRRRERNEKLAFLEIVLQSNEWGHDERFRLVDVHRARFGVAPLCRWLGVSRNGYYRWRRHPASARDLEDAALALQLGDAQQRARGTYGRRRLQAALRREGQRTSLKRIGRLLREHAAPPLAEEAPAPRLVERGFEPEEPNRIWVADVTYVWTDEGWLYVATVIDLFSRMIVGWASSNRVDRHLCIEALASAIAGRRPEPGLVHHSDRGAQYGSRDYRALLESNGMTCSMSRRATCHDNAVAESFWRTLKRELINRRVFRSRAEAHEAIRDYIDVFFNRERLHSSLGYLSPVEFEAAYWSVTVG